ARARPLDLDHVRAVVRQHLGGAWPHHDLSEIDDFDAVERQPAHTCTSKTRALADGRSPGSPPWPRTLSQICCAGTSRSLMPRSTAIAAATPAAWPIDMQGGISREIFWACSVAE